MALMVALSPLAYEIKMDACAASTFTAEIKEIPSKSGWNPALYPAHLGDLFAFDVATLLSQRAGRHKWSTH